MITFGHFYNGRKRVKLLSKMSSAQRIAYSNVWIVFKLLLVMPATITASEHSFSALWRNKTT